MKRIIELGEGKKFTSRDAHNFAASYGVGEPKVYAIQFFVDRMFLSYARDADGIIAAEKRSSMAKAEDAISELVKTTRDYRVVYGPWERHDPADDETRDRLKPVVEPIRYSRRFYVYMR